MSPLGSRTGGLLSELRRNLPWLEVLFIGQGALFWMPVFVLYMSERLAPGTVLGLEAVYYGVVVVAEVPSGWLSDRLGRRGTLVVSGLGWTLGALAFAGGDGVAAFAAGQVSFALARAFASGTDSAVLYETLLALGREAELRDRLGRLSALSFVSLGLASAVGGVLGAVDLRWAYGASVVSGLVATAAAWALVEPPRPDRDVASGTPWEGLSAALRHPLLRRVLLATTALNVFIHIPYELHQPWLDLALEGQGTAWVSGVTVALGFGVAALGSRAAAPLVARVGFRWAMAAVLAACAGVMGLLGLGTSPWLVPVLVLRSLPTGLMGPVADAEIHPRVASSVRATYLSIQSLAGRLAFSGVLLGLAAVVGPTWSAPGMRTILWAFGALAVGATALWLVAPAIEAENPLAPERDSR